MKEFSCMIFYIQKQDLMYTSVDDCISPTYRKMISFTCLWMTVSVLHTETRSHLHICGLLYQSYIQKEDLIYMSVDDCISPTYRNKISFTRLWITVSVLHTETRPHLHICGWLYQSYKNWIHVLAKHFQTINKSIPHAEDITYQKSL